MTHNPSLGSLFFFNCHHPFHGKKQRVKMMTSFDLKSATLTVNTFTNGILEKAFNISLVTSVYHM